MIIKNLFKKFLVSIAFFKPEKQGYYEAKEQQRKLFLAMKEQLLLERLLMKSKNI